MSKKDEREKPRRFVRLDDITNFFGNPNPPPEMVREDVKPIKATAPKVVEKPAEKADKKQKPETLSSIKKKVDTIYQKHISNLPEHSRMITARDVKSWILNNPSINVNSPEFLSWFRSPDGENVNAYIKHFASLLMDLGIDHQAEVEVKGYVYDFFIEPMSLYIDIDPISLETDDPKAKISVTVDKAKIDIVDIWRKINETRDARCKPFRFMSIKERLYAQGVREFLNEYVDWYFQKLNDEGIAK